MTIAAQTTAVRRHDFLEPIGLVALSGVAGALQFSIAIAEILLTVAIACWIVLALVNRERLEVPRFFWPLAAYAAITLVSAAFSPEPQASLRASGGASRGCR